MYLDGTEIYHLNITPCRDCYQKAEVGPGCSSQDQYFLL